MKANVLTLMMLGIFVYLCCATALAQNPELVTQMGHSEAIGALAFSNDGRTLASASIDGSINLWEVSTGRELRAFSGHTGPVTALIFSPDSKMLLSGSEDETIKYWDLGTGAAVRTLKLGSAIRSLAVSPDGKWLALIGCPPTLEELLELVSLKRSDLPKYCYAELRDFATGKNQLTLTEERYFGSEQGQSSELRSIAFSRDGRIVASSGTLHTMRLWDVVSGKPLLEIGPAEGPVLSVAFSPKLNTLVSNSSSSVQFWDVTTGRALGKVDAKCSSRMALSPDGRSLACDIVGSNPEVILWDTTTGLQLQRLTDQTSAIGSLAFSPDSRTLALASGNKIKIFDIQRGLESLTLIGYGSNVRAVAFNPGSNKLVSRAETGTPMTNADDKVSTISVWDMSNDGRVAHFAPVRGLFGHLTFNLNGRTLISANANKVLDIWDVSSGRELKNPITKAHGVGRFLALSRDFRIMADVVDSGNVGLWNTETGQKLRKLGSDIPSSDLISLPRLDPIDSLAIPGLGANPEVSPKSKAAPDAATMRRLQEQGIEKIVRDQEAIPGYISVAQFSPNGRILATEGTIGFHSVRLWSVADGRLLHAMNGHSNQVESLAFSPNGKILASSSLDRTIRLWDVSKGSSLLTLSVPESTASVVNPFVTFSSDSRFVALASDNVIRIWNSLTGDLWQSLSGHTSQVNALAYSANGRFLASASSDGSIRLWDARSGTPIAALFGLGDQGWVITDYEGRFDTGNLDEIRGLSWVFPDDPFRALAPEVFVRDYYVPKLLPKLLRGEKLPEIRPLSSLNRSQPVVALIKVEPEVRREMASVTVRVISTRSEIQKDANGNYLESGAFDLRLYRDGQLVGQWPEPETAETTTIGVGSPVDLESWRKIHELRLVNGEYVHIFRHVCIPQRAGVDKVQFTAYAFNSDRVKSLTTAPLEYLIPRPSSEPQAVVARRAYLISMGVNANQSRWNLDFAVPSAQDAARLLHEKMARNYEVVDISLLSTLATDSPRALVQQATKTNLKAVLDLLAGKGVDSSLRDAVDPDHKLQQATPDDAVVLFISSHGYADPEGTFYVVPYDTGATTGITEDLLTRCHVHPEDRSPSCERAKAFLERTISSQEFANWWVAVDAGEIVMILDSCHSAAAPGREFRPGPLGDTGLGQLSYDKGMQILTATQPDKSARATLLQTLGHSLLVQALSEEAKAHPQETLVQWLHDAKERVPMLTRRLYPELIEADRQVPELFDFSVTERH